MNKLITICLVFIFSLTVNPLFAQKGVNIGYINSQELLLLMPERDSLAEVIKKDAIKLKNELANAERELQSKAILYQAMADTMSELWIQSKNEELKQHQQLIENFRQAIPKKIEEMEMFAIQYLINLIKQASAIIAKEMKLAYVVDISNTAIVYFGGGIDMTAAVMKQLGIKQEKRIE